MVLRQRRPSYDYNSSFWQLAGLIMMIIIMMRARNYNYDYCGAKLWLLSPALLKLIEYGLVQRRPSYDYKSSFLVARRDYCDDYDYGACQEL